MKKIRKNISIDPQLVKEVEMYKNKLKPIPSFSAFIEKCLWKEIKKEHKEKKE